VNGFARRHGIFAATIRIAEGEKPPENLLLARAMA
jgi:hypothetical protein